MPSLVPRLAALVIVTACASTRAPAPPQATALPSTHLPEHESNTAPVPSPSSSVAAFSSTRQTNPPTSPQPSVVFPPADIPPPFARSAQPGDGAWQPLGDPGRGDRAATEPRVLFQTVIHPHLVSRFKALHLAAIDLSRVRLRYVPGTDDVTDSSVQPERLGVRPGLVAAEDLPQLVAIVNGGFKPRHGGWGMRVQGHTLIPPRDPGCTVALYADGRVAIRPWPQLAGVDDELTSFRQTPPCLVEDGRRHQQLEARNERPWGGHDPRRKTRRRSALGIDPTGQILLYGLGVELEPSELAEGMRLAGAHYAAQLDINWSWTRFLLVGARAPDAPLQITGTLVPEMVHTRRGYLDKPEARDFFYLVRQQK